MITERLMSLGSWSLQLAEDTPRYVLDRLDVTVSGFGHIAITPNAVDAGAMSDADMLSLSRYTGRYHSQPDEFTMSGAGMAACIADGDGKGPGYSGGLATASGLFSEWVVALRPHSLAAGITAAISGTFAKFYPRTNLREPLDEVCAYFNAEWRITNDGKFDIGPVGTLFRSVPNSVVVRSDGGRDMNILGIAGELTAARDVKNYTRRVNYYTGTTGAPTVNSSDGGIADIDVRYRAFDGTAIRMDRFVEDFSNTPTTAGQGLADAEFRKTINAHREITLSGTQYDIAQDVRVGDALYVYDPSRGIRDVSNEVFYRGAVIYPQVIRCVGYTWPVRKGMGVYFRRHVRVAGVWTAEWTDLTGYVRFESGETRVDIGSMPRKPK